MIVTRFVAGFLCVVGLLLASCASAYYGTMEKLGFPKRDILVSRVEKARDAQAEAKEEFTDALSRFLELTRVEPGEIETVYRRLAAELEDCEERAQEVRERIEAIEDVSEALYDEWQDEAASIQNPQDRRESERLLRETRVRSTHLIRTMNIAADRMDPILQQFRDKVLVLKANLNAQAVAGLSGSVAVLEEDVARLVDDMERAIQQAEAFLAGLEPAVD